MLYANVDADEMLKKRLQPIDGCALSVEQRIHPTTSKYFMVLLMQIAQAIRKKQPASKCVSLELCWYFVFSVFLVISVLFGCSLFVHCCLRGKCGSLSYFMLYAC